MPSHQNHSYDGFGLAWAIAEELAFSKKCLTFFATHFHELTQLEEHEAKAARAGGAKSIFNLHVTADTTSTAITMLHEVQEGSCDRSFGLHVAQLARFPKPVLDDAARKAAALERMSGGHIAAVASTPGAGGGTISSTPTDVDVDASAAPPTKRMRLETKEETIAFLRKFASIPAAELGTTAGAARVRALVLSGGVAK